VRNRGFEFSFRNISIHARKVLLHAVNLRHGTDGFVNEDNGVFSERVEPIGVKKFPYRYTRQAVLCINPVVSKTWNTQEQEEFLAL
jgi:hypothetical protein